MPPFTASEHLFGNLLHRQIRPAIRLATEGGAQHQQGLLRAHLIAQSAELIGGQALCGDIDEIPFGRVAVLPVH